jgi:phage terminase large subunit
VQSRPAEAHRHAGLRRSGQKLRRVRDDVERIFAREHPATWFLGARSFAKTADAEAQGRTLSGLHAPYMLYLLDETGDMPPAVLRSAEQGLGNCRWGKIVQGGNTTSQTGYLYLAVDAAAPLAPDQHHGGSGRPEPDAARRRRVGARADRALRPRERRGSWRSSSGKFPPGGINTLLTPDEVNAALGRGIKADDYQHVQKRLGIDVARFGDDRTVIFPRQGLAPSRRS